MILLEIDLELVLYLIFISLKSIDVTIKTSRWKNVPQIEEDSDYLIKKQENYITTITGIVNVTDDVIIGKYEIFIVLNILINYLLLTV
jgi:hypothetical protein